MGIHTSKHAVLLLIVKVFLMQMYMLFPQN